MHSREFQIGELSKLSGVTVRTLRYYDEINLLQPSNTTSSGYRLYHESDVIRLQQIRSLQQLGFSLDEVGHYLNHKDITVLETLKLHAERLGQQRDQIHNLCQRVDTLIATLESNRSLTVDDFLNLLQETTMFEKYYTPEQLEQLKARAETVGADRMQEVQQVWHDLIAAVRHEKEKGTSPDSSRMKTLAAQWQGLIDEFTGGDKGIERSLSRMYAEQPDVAQQRGFSLDSDLMSFVQRAMTSSDTSKEYPDCDCDSETEGQE